MRVNVRCNGCGRHATVRDSAADLLYYCELCLCAAAAVSRREARRRIANWSARLLRAKAGR